MSIRTRLALQFTLLVALLMAMGLSVIYYLEKESTQHLFEQRLLERARITGALFLEADEQSRAATEKVQRRFMQELPEEHVGIFDAQGNARFLEQPSSFPNDLLQQLLRKRQVSVIQNDRQTVGLFYHDNQGDFRILASAVNVNGLERLAYLRLVMSGVLVVSLAMSFVLGRIFAQSALEPVRHIVQHARNIGASDLHLRVPVGQGRDELTELAETFNLMIQRLEAAFRQQQSFISNASHELRTPLTAMIGQMDIILNRPRPTEMYQEALHSSLIEAQKLKDIVNRLLQLAQLDANETTLPVGGSLRLDEVLYEACEEISVVQLDCKVSIQVQQLPEDAERLTIPGDRNLFRLALTNLISNACKFSNNYPVVCTLAYEANQVSLCVIDHGIGIAPEDLAHVRQTFFRATNARSFGGFGVGLALAEKIITLHGGYLEIESELHKGTTMRVVLPLVA
ncbi:sensor histidine kinase [Hymenobacter wooponensis]|uniref:histidine kinase n=1 Tax=Hymenobacter wooponensis TaxID=1525360 RepID=A0A4Z0MTT4_9BACT|nr:ATP-binding protein [Hymenobacter wooponensis]TGD83091.1 HAMP domain-containing protein [Hymenobacter wooponensis]